MERDLLKRLRAQERVPLFTSPPVGGAAKSAHETEETEEDGSATGTGWLLVRTGLDVRACSGAHASLLQMISTIVVLAAITAVYFDVSQFPQWLAAIDFRSLPNAVMTASLSVWMSAGLCLALVLLVLLPPPLLKRAVLVYCVAAVVFGRIEWQKFLSRRYPREPEEDDRAWDEVHARNARLVERTIRKLRGFWVKVGIWCHDSRARPHPLLTATMAVGRAVPLVPR